MKYLAVHMHDETHECLLPERKRREISRLMSESLGLRT
jgi:hypothetical protein